MTLLEQIRAACTADLIASRDDAAIAAAVTAARPPLRVPCLIGFGRVLDTLGSDAGAAFLDALDALRPQVRKLHYVWLLLDKGELDLSLSSTRLGLDELVSTDVLTDAQAKALKALAEVPDFVSVTDVQKSLYNDDGSFRS